MLIANKWDVWGVCICTPAYVSVSVCISVTISISLQGPHGELVTGPGQEHGSPACLSMSDGRGVWMGNAPTQEIQKVYYSNHLSHL